MNSRTRLAITPPAGSIGAARAKVAYCEHLISRYQDYQKADWTGKSDFKYMAILTSLKRKFGGPWKLLDEGRFEELASFLQRRIDGTIIGKGNRVKGHSNYSSFESWQCKT